MMYHYSISSYSSALILLLLIFVATIQAHTWIEELSVIAPNGTFVGTPGYPRGLVDRTANTDPNAGNVYELPPDGRSTGNAILASDLMCKSSQMIGVQTPGNPALVASPGDQIAMRYQENGHVTQPALPPGKPEGSGTVFVYGTEKPSNSDTYLGIHRVWNEAGTGGDARGVLLATRYFDDGQCYQVNPSAISTARQKEFSHTADPQMNMDLWCQTDVQIPTTATGNYTLYWVWEWPTLDSTGKVTTNQSYTSCMDVTLTPESTSKAEAVNFAADQSLNHAAIAAQMSAQFLLDPTASVQTFMSGGPTPTFANSIASATGSSSAGATSLASPSSSGASQHSSAAGVFVTVTVTASAKVETETVTITATANGDASSLSSIQPSSSSPMKTQTTAPPPSLTPFLSPGSQIASPPTPASTLAARQEYAVRGRVVRV